MIHITSQYLESQRVLKIICHKHGRPVRGSERHKQRRHITATPNIGRNDISHNSSSCIHKHQSALLSAAKHRCMKMGTHTVGHGEIKHLSDTRRKRLKYRDSHRNVNLVCMYTVGCRKLPECKNITHKHTQQDRREYKQESDEPSYGVVKLWDTFMYGWSGSVCT